MHSVCMGKDVLFLSSEQSAKYPQLGQTIGMGLVIAEVAYGYGRPAYYLTPHQFQEFLKYVYGEWLQVRHLIFKYSAFRN